MRIDPPKAGETFGSLTLTGKYEHRKHSHLHLEVVCLCGNRKWKRRAVLILGKNKSCGAECLSPLNKRIIQKDDRYHHLVATGRSRHSGPPSSTHYEFKCDCGRFVFLNSSNVINGKNKSCCHIDCKLSVNEHHGKVRHPSGEKYPNGKIKRSKEYMAWCMAKIYCYNKNHPAYKNTGETGIAMCDEWKDSFIQFHKDMGDAPSPNHRFTRKDKSGDFEPDNCYWREPKRKGSSPTLQFS